MKWLKQGYYFLIYTNLLIAVAAMAQCALTYLIFECPFDYSIIGIEGAATLLLYNFSLFLSKPKDPQASAYRRTRWVFRHEWLLWLNSLLALVFLSYAVFTVHFISLLFLVFIGLVSVAYSFPLFSYNGKKVGVRQLPGLKIFHIALVWTMSSVCLPVLELYMEGNTVEIQRFATLFVMKFVFLVICTLPFDIRDIRQDSYYHLKTIPSMLGARRAIQLCYVLLLIHCTAILLSGVPLSIKAGLLLTNGFIGLVLKMFVFRNHDHYHYAYLLDMALVVQFVLVWLMQFFFHF